jgi:DNA-directed RNA polymerase subunit alpha
MGLALKDSPPGFDPSAALAVSDESYEDDDLSFAETEQY